MNFLVIRIKNQTATQISQKGYASARIFLEYINKTIIFLMSINLGNLFCGDCRSDL